MRVASLKNWVYDSKTKTAPVFPAPERSDPKVVLGSATAEATRHDAISCRHNRSSGNGNQWETSVSHDFLPLDISVGCLRSHQERKAMHFSAIPLCVSSSNGLNIAGLAGGRS